MGLWRRSTPPEAPAAAPQSKDETGVPRHTGEDDAVDAGHPPGHNPFRLSDAETAPGSATSSMGGAVAFDGSLLTWMRTFVDFYRDEYRRPSVGTIQVRSGADRHRRPPEWMEYKNIAIDGTLLSEEEKASHSGTWEKRYKRELDVAEAIQEVRKQRRMEADHDIIGVVAQVRRFMGWSKPLDESYAKHAVDVRYQLQEEADRLRGEAEETGEGDTSVSFSLAAGRAPRADTATPGTIRTVVDAQTGTVRRLGGEESQDAGSSAVTTAWRAFMTTAETGRPLATVASEYKPRVDFYGLDPFLDSAPSVIWFSTKVGLFIGLVQGTARAVQAINVDVQFLKTSGVGVLSILNMSVFASAVKWGGNTAIFAIAFCLGDRLATVIKRRTRPSHEASQRSVVNYVAGLSAAGATVGVLPWWVLSDVPLAMRLAASGAVVGGVLGLGVGIVLGRLVSLNISRLDATSRQLRRYEAVMLRQRQWVQDQLSARRSEAYVWW